MTEVNDNLENETTQISGDFRGGAEEYPTSHKGEMGRLERRALREGWLNEIDGKATAMVRRQIDDAINSENPRDRRGAFTAVMKAKSDHEKKETTQINIQNNVENNPSPIVIFELADNGRVPEN